MTRRRAGVSPGPVSPREVARMQQSARKLIERAGAARATFEWVQDAIDTPNEARRDMMSTWVPDADAARLLATRLLSEMTTATEPSTTWSPRLTALESKVKFLEGGVGNYQRIVGGGRMGKSRDADEQIATARNVATTANIAGNVLLAVGTGGASAAVQLGSSVAYGAATGVGESAFGDEVVEPGRVATNAAVGGLKSLAMVGIGSTMETPVLDMLTSGGAGVLDSVIERKNQRR